MATQVVNSVARPEAYFLPSDSRERKRLAVQHKIILNNVGRKYIHAPIDLTLIRSVLETATGSGIWLEEVANQIPPTAELIGIDISPNLFPVSPPENIRFLQGSVLNLPEEWTNKFDLVHQRLLVAGFRRDEWCIALDEIYRVLRPGAWFQLYEIYTWEPRGPALQRMTDLVSHLFASRGMETWPCSPDRWRSLVEEAGFENIQASLHSWPMGKWAGEDGVAGRDAHHAWMIGIKAPVLNAGGFGIVSGEEEFEEWVEDITRELDALDGTASLSVMVCGQKPL